MTHTRTVYLRPGEVFTAELGTVYAVVNNYPHPSTATTTNASFSVAHGGQAFSWMLYATRHRRPVHLATTPHQPRRRPHSHLLTHWTRTLQRASLACPHPWQHLSRQPPLEARRLLL